MLIAINSRSGQFRNQMQQLSAAGFGMHVEANHAVTLKVVDERLIISKQIQYCVNAIVFPFIS